MNERWLSLDAQVQVSVPLPAEVPLQWSSGPTTGLEERLVVVQRGALPARPAKAEVQRLALPGRHVAVVVQGHELWLEDHLHVQLGAPSVLTVAGETGVDTWALAFTELHRAGGWLPLHATVVSSGEQAVALAGASGAGKSTAALRLLALGYAVVAEDRAWWNPLTGQVLGLDRHLRAFEDSVQQFAPPALRAQLTDERDIHGKRLLPLPPIPVKERVTLQQFFVLGAGNPLNGTQRVRAAWETTGVPLTAVARQQVMQGVQRLLPLMSTSELRREDVLAAVQLELGTRTTP